MWTDQLWGIYTQRRRLQAMNTPNNTGGVKRRQGPEQTCDLQMFRTCEGERFDTEDEITSSVSFM